MFDAHGARRRSGGVGAAGLALLGLALLGGCSSCQEYKDRIAELDGQVATMQSQLSERDANLRASEQLKSELQANLDKCEADKEVLVKRVNEVVMVRIPEKLLFASGSDRIRSEMQPTLRAIADAIGERPDWDVYVEGYTDDKKIKPDYQDKWPTNWELGAYRAAAVISYLTNDLKLDAARFAAVSYGPYRPADSNETPAGRANNRFVQLVMHKPERG
jgi:chemotaxis protein MotB